MTAPENTLADAFAYHKRGDLATAEGMYRAILAVDPRNPDLLYLLGMLCLDTGRAELAGGFLESAIDAAAAQGRTVDPGWHLALGSARQAHDDHDAALAAFSAVLRDDPQSPDGNFCAATALRALGRTQEAIAAYRKVLADNPDHAEAANNLGGVLSDTGQMREAAELLASAVALRPDYPEALLNYGQLLETLGRFEGAAQHLSRAVALTPGDSVAACALARCLSLAGRVGEAAAILEKQRDRQPNDSLVLARLGAIRLFQGDGRDAADLCRAALAIDPGRAEAHLRLTESGCDDNHGERVDQIGRVLARQDLSSGDRAQLHYARAARLEALGRYGDAFEDYRKGAGLRRKGLDEIAMSYQPGQHQSRVDALIAAFGTGRFAQAGGGSDSETPVFIVGMPRSGTSLVEQILASHPKVAGAGELMAFGGAASRLSASAGYPERPVPEPLLRGLADSYLKRLGRDGAGALRITDKMPTNFLNLGLIALTLPRARIIHCRRDPVDTCVSCYFQSFAGPGQPFSYDLADLGHYYGQYTRLMAHWRDVLPLGMLEVDYETLIANQEEESRRIIDFLGLDWDPACLEFYKTARAVVTASHSRVRQPVYSTSIGRWERYRDRLDPLLKALSRSGQPVEPV